MSSRTSLRKHRNLARQKLGVYVNRMKEVRRARASLARAEPETIEFERASKRHRNAVATANRYYDAFRLHYDAIAIPPDPENDELNARLSTVAHHQRAVFVMRTGFGKGFSFPDRHIAAALGMSLRTVDEHFGKAMAALDGGLHTNAPAQANEIITEIAQLTPELIHYLRSNDSHVESLRWDIYEQLVAEFFASWGYQVSLVGRNRSTSADVIAVRPPDSSGIAVRIFIEVKKTANRIGVDTINSVLGSIYSESLTGRFHAAVIVSSAGFRDISKISVPTLRHLGVELRDGNDVRRWLREYAPSKTGLWLKPT